MNEIVNLTFDPNGTYGGDPMLNGLFNKLFNGEFAEFLLSIFALFAKHYTYLDADSFKWIFTIISYQQIEIFYLPKRTKKNQNNLFLCSAVCIEFMLFCVRHVRMLSTLAAN